jgi:hypothetical protein
MKRTSPETSKTAKRNTAALGAQRLTAVRGGNGLGIAVEVVDPPPSIMTQQHNETLVQL